MKNVETKEFWFQEAAFGVLQNDLAPKRGFPSGLVVYHALCAVGGETASEPGPDRDGKPFQITLARLAQMNNQPLELTKARLRDLVRLKLIDPFDWPKQFAPLNIRITTLPRRHCDE